MAKTWKRSRAAEQIDKRLKEVETVTVVDFARDMSLESIPVTKAYRMDAVHLYADILNISEMLGVTGEEGVTCHRRTLRFLNLHYRAVDRILSRVDARRVDFHNQRLHAVVYKPYNSETGAERRRVERAVAIAQLVIDVLRETGDDDDKIPNARMRVGIDTGQALAVNNGRRGNREPLFLGEPANHAAKLSGAGRAEGIFLTNRAREAIGLKKVDKSANAPLSASEIEACQTAADLGVTVEEIVKEWRDDLEKNPIGSIDFSRQTPPLCHLDISVLTPKNSKRQEAVSIYADIDNFTAYVGRNIEDSPEDVVRALHVLRSEMERVLSRDFAGRRIRFIGDCLHGLVCEGTARTTDEEATVSTATLCAGALRSSFELALEKLDDAGVDVEGLGLAIGFELGPMTITRLGLKGEQRVRCSVSRGVLASEDEQRRCDGTETAIGEAAYKAGSQGVKNLFGQKRKAAKIDYDEAVDALADQGDTTAKAARDVALAVAAPEVKGASGTLLRPYTRWR
ncbi:adenylate/guanylate cyclase domain-containing protein [Rubellimicrobium aerolatum]|uniref:Adenylate/guanylate cyclase domain-containing protein n=1 Tax=Rubellimicrobium aerolatum TaxID=490979 RepID=A0ABW0S8X2_9RHOB|nr:adenylate/guanylate cyclase domain-containing protein [Rubellimicrobium aerolatum]MBP1804675.1 class 3 adenylate cyclase [Rubellimicrobium aerolatum]